jgi:hypothetical protein
MNSHRASKVAVLGTLEQWRSSGQWIHFPYTNGSYGIIIIIIIIIISGKK